MNITACFHSGDHRYSTFFFDWLNSILPVSVKNSSKISFNLHQSCYYVDPQEPGQINKIAGYSSLFIHRNSYRFGWRPILGDRVNFELFKYIYEKGVRREEYIGRYEYGVWHTSSVEREDLPKGLLWRCFPYIGGKLAAQSFCYMNVLFN